jgi:hypothetical protein
VRGPGFVGRSRDSCDLDNSHNSREMSGGKTKNIQMILNYISVNIKVSNFLSVRTVCANSIYVNSMQLDGSGYSKDYRFRNAE